MCVQQCCESGSLSVPKKSLKSQIWIQNKQFRIRNATVQDILMEKLLCSLIKYIGHTGKTYQYFIRETHITGI
jgi:hypothetical protein